MSEQKFLPETPFFSPQMNMDPVVATDIFSCPSSLQEEQASSFACQRPPSLLPRLPYLSQYFNNQKNFRPLSNLQTRSTVPTKFQIGQSSTGGGYAPMKQQPYHPPSLHCSQEIQGFERDGPHLQSAGVLDKCRAIEHEKQTGKFCSECGERLR